MANYVERVALAGAFFFGLQLWEGYRGQRSRDLFFAERASGGSLPSVSLDGALAERRTVVGAAKPILNVKSFSAENLEVRTLQRRGFVRERRGGCTRSEKITPPPPPRAPPAPHFSATPTRAGSSRAAEFEMTPELSKKFSCMCAYMCVKR